MRGANPRQLILKGRGLKNVESLSPRSPFVDVLAQNSKQNFF
nr:MAG TPA: hypothetical protein [Caudoviricetes sp.]